MEKDRNSRNLFIERLREQHRKHQEEIAFDRADPDQAREEFWMRHSDLKRSYRLMAIEGDEPGPRETTQGILMDMIEEDWAVDDDLLADAAHMDSCVDQFMLRQYRDEREIGHRLEQRWDVVSAELEREAEARDLDETVREIEADDDREIGD